MDADIVNNKNGETNQRYSFGLSGKIKSINTSLVSDGSNASQENHTKDFKVSHHVSKKVKNEFINNEDYADAKI